MADRARIIRERKFLHYEKALARGDHLVADLLAYDLI